jgi:hypothetical protein
LLQNAKTASSDLHLRFCTGKTKTEIFCIRKPIGSGARILSLFLSMIEDGLGGIQIGLCLGKLLENVFLIIFLNFNLGRDFETLLEML